MDQRLTCDLSQLHPHRTSRHRIQHDKRYWLHICVRLISTLSSSRFMLPTESMSTETVMRSNVGLHLSLWVDGIWDWVGLEVRSWAGLSRTVSGGRLGFDGRLYYWVPQDILGASKAGLALIENGWRQSSSLSPS